MQQHTKQPWEQYPLAFDFAGKLPPGAALDEGTVSAIDTEDETDATDTVLDSDEAIIRGQQAQFFVKGGLNGHTYHITLRVTLTPGTPAPGLEEDLELVVEEI